MPSLLGLRQKPGTLALGVFAIVPMLYRVGLGGILGRTFLLLIYKGRKSGKTYQAALMILSYDRSTDEVVSLAMYGPQTGWMKNIVASPALAIDVAGKRYQPIQRFLAPDEAVEVIERFRAAHPWRVRLATRILGWGKLATDAEVREFVRAKPFVGFRPFLTEKSAAQAV